MKHRITALLLALGLTAGLAACAPKEPAPSESLSPSPEVTQTVTPDPDPIPTGDVPTVDPEGTDLPDKGTPPPESNSPMVDPTAPAVTPAPTPTPAETAPAEPSDTPSIAVPAASEVYSAVSKAAGDTTATMDASAVLENFYNLSADDLEDFAFYIPELSANIEELFIARVKEGKLDTVKAACQSRLDGMKEEGAFYPGTGVYLDSAKIETQGDWIILCVCPDSAGAVKAFQDCVK